MNHIQEIYNIYLESSGVSIDTRTIERGNIFFAIRGLRFDGHRFVEKALQLGAKYSIIDDPQFESDRTILVQDTLATLQELSRFHRNHQPPDHVIGITGSNGKTTTKELIRSVLNTTYKTYATAGNLNNHLGVPLTLLKHQSHHDVAIIEMGANKKGDIQELCEIAQIDYGLITNIGRAHLEGFGGIDGVRKTKVELYDYVCSRDGLIFQDPDDVSLKATVPEGCRVNRDFPQLTVKRLIPYLVLEYVDQSGRLHEINTHLTGEYNVQNIRYAMAVGQYFKISIHEVIKGIATYVPENNRSELRRVKNAYVILDAYNANPDSMTASIQNLNVQESDNKMVVLGDMLELGDRALELHQEIVQCVEESEIKEAFLYGSLFGQCEVSSKFRKYTDFDQLKADFIPRLEKEGSCILIKGSRKMGLERLLDLS